MTAFVPTLRTPAAPVAAAVLCALVATGCATRATSSSAIASVPQPVSSPAAAGATLPDVSERAWRVYRSAVVIDMHNDMPSKILEEAYDPDVRHAGGFGDGTGHTDLPRLVESELTAVFMSAWIDATYARTSPDSSFERAMEQVATIHRFVDRHPDRLLLATTAADVRRAKAERKIAILIGVEGGHAIEASLENLRALHARGARYLTLTWNNGNQWAGSSVGVNGTRTGGLTEFGREVIHEMNRLGMLVDLSHVSEATFADAVATSAAPVIASHSSARALNDHVRNLSDDQLRAVARSGGVVNVNFFSRFIDPAYLRAWQAADARLGRARAAAIARHGADTEAARREIAGARASLFAGIPETTLSVLIDHIDHIARVAGVNHVGLGSDFDGVSALPAGMDDVTRLPRIAQALLDRGWSDDDVRKLLGGNMLRVMQQVLDRAAAPDRR